MEHLCPNIDQLVSCFSCGSQSLPPYRLCLDAHVGCTPCAKYLPQCVCGHRFAVGSHLAFDWLVLAMKLKCKYRTATVAERAADNGNGDECAEDSCANRWFSIQELREHYRKDCKNNVFKCPLHGCNHVARVDTIVDHYELVHGPFVTLTPDNHQPTYGITFKIFAYSRVEVVRKIFNGYFLFNVRKYRRKSSREPAPNPQLAMQNINPTDPLRYTYDASIEPAHKTITITVSIVGAF